MKIEPPAPPSLKAELKTQAEKPQRPSSVQEILQRLAAQGEKNFQALVLADSTLIQGSGAAPLFKVLIKIASRELIASSPLALKKGQRLDIELLADKGLVIRQIRHADDSVEQQALRLLTAQQEELAPLLSLLQQYSTPPKGGPAVVSSLEQQLEDAVQALLSKLPTLAQLKTPGQMKQALLLSGVFHEQQLKQLSQNTASPARKNTLQKPANSAAGTSPPIDLDFKSLLKRFETDLNQLKTTAQTSNEHNEPESTQQKTSPSTDQNSSKTRASALTTALEKTLKTTDSSLSGANPPSSGKTAPSPLTSALPTRAVVSPVYGPLPVKLAASLVETGTTQTVIHPKEKKATVDTAIETLLRQTSGVLAKIQLNQLASLDQNRPASSSDSNTLQQWFFELPLNTGTQMSNVAIHIQQKASKNSGQEASQEKSWQLDLGFDLGEFGKVHIEVFLIQQSARSILWAEHGPTFSRIHQQLGQLQTSLEQLGVNVERLECRQGKVPEHRPTRISTRLIDVTS